MVLNFVWVGLFTVAAIFGIVRYLTGADVQVFASMSQATFDGAKTGFEISIGLVGTLTLWLGLMKVGEAGGAIRTVSKVLSPLLTRMFPGLPADHPAAGAMVLNFAANLLGLDNAATPAGLKAVRELETLNPHPGTATNHQIMFMALHAASLTLFPVSIMAIRASAGARNPADIFLPILIASLCSALGAFLLISFIQKIRLLDPVLLTFLFGALALVAGIVTFASMLPHAEVESLSSMAGGFLLMAAILWFLLQAAFHRVNAWEAFAEGARDGFKTAVQIIPFLVGILVAVGVFRASGAMDYLVKGLWALLSWTGLPADSVNAIPTMIMKPLSGGGARGLAVDCMKTCGPDSFAGRLASVLQGSTDTTLYVLALYSGAAGLKNTRYALPCMLFADLCGFAGAIGMALLFFR